MDHSGLQASPGRAAALLEGDALGWTCNSVVGTYHAEGPSSLPSTGIIEWGEERKDEDVESHQQPRLPSQNNFLKDCDWYLLLNTEAGHWRDGSVSKALALKV